MTVSSERQAANQRVFDEAWHHIIAQGEASLAADRHNCAYRSSKGLGCAFSPAIENYDEEMETLSAADVVEQFPLNVHAWALAASDHLVNSVQAAHDNAQVVAHKDDFVDEFKASMQSVAVHYDLVCPS